MPGTLAGNPHFIYRLNKAISIFIQFVTSEGLLKPFGNTRKMNLEVLVLYSVFTCSMFKHILFIEYGQKKKRQLIIPSQYCLVN